MSSCVNGCARPPSSFLNDMMMTVLLALFAFTLLACCVGGRWKVMEDDEFTMSISHPSFTPLTNDRVSSVVDIAIHLKNYLFYCIT